MNKGQSNNQLKNGRGSAERGKGRLTEEQQVNVQSEDFNELEDENACLSDDSLDTRARMSSF